MLEKARLGTNRATLICAAAEAMPFEAHSFDLIFCVNSFHHFRDPTKFLRDSRSLLRNNGWPFLALTPTLLVPTGICTITFRVFERKTSRGISPSLSSNVSWP